MYSVLGGKVSRGSQERGKLFDKVDGHCRQNQPCCTWLNVAYTSVKHLDPKGQHTRNLWVPPSYFNSSMEFVHLYILYVNTMYIPIESMLCCEMWNYVCLHHMLWHGFVLLHHGVFNHWRTIVHKWVFWNLGRFFLCQFRVCFFRHFFMLRVCMSFVGI